MKKDTLNYLSGLNNEFATEALAGALPLHQNSPRQVPHGLFAEQLSGTAFTAPRKENARSWVYRIRPSVVHSGFIPYAGANAWHSAPFSAAHITPNPLRWDPLAFPAQPTHFIDGLFTVCGHGDLNLFQGAAIHQYAINTSMDNLFFYNADGELLLLPESGALLIHTEMGSLQVNPGEVVVIPRGIKFQMMLVDDKARGYVCENYGTQFRLPELGVIGANGLANPRDFQIPTARYWHETGAFKLIAKMQGQFFITELSHHPLDVVAWHGNYVPYKYALDYFNTMNTVSVDHPDPSIFTVLTSPTPITGVANVDFVIFPKRWLVAAHTFRPPYYHRNIMSEYMGLIRGEYDAKGEGFVPGSASLHNSMTAHGPDRAAYTAALQESDQPRLIDNTLAFMFESRAVWRPTAWAMQAPTLQHNYLDCWKNLPVSFS